MLCYGLKEHPYKGGENSFGAKANCELEGYYEPVVDSSSKTSYVCGLHTTPAYGPAGFRAVSSLASRPVEYVLLTRPLSSSDTYRRHVAILAEKRTSLLPLKAWTILNGTAVAEVLSCSISPRAAPIMILCITVS